MLHRQARRVFEVLGHPLRHLPSVGGTRKPGTTCLIEDVAFHIEDLPEATAELQQLIARHGYEDARIYGHALEGTITSSSISLFSSEAEVKRYENLMNDVKTLVGGQIRWLAEGRTRYRQKHGSFVRHEWGRCSL